MNSTKFVEEIIEKVSWARDIHLEHIYDYDELLGYVFMDEISIAFINIANEAFILKVNTDENLMKMKIFLEVIENGIHSDSDEVRNLIKVSFLENITPNIKTFSFINEIMGDSSSAMLEYTHATYLRS